MLEGQVAVLSAGTLAADEGRRRARRAGAGAACTGADQQSYLLYPDRDLPGLPREERHPGEGGPVLPAPLPPGGLGRPAHRAARRRRARTASPRGSPTADRCREALLALQAELAPRPRRGGDRARSSRSTSGCSSTGPSPAAAGPCSPTRGSAASTGTWWASCSSPSRSARSRPSTPALRRPSQKRLADRYHRDPLRGGRRSDKSPAVYGAFPLDPYSHTPAHAGAQQPGMTGQVKEEISPGWGSSVCGSGRGGSSSGRSCSARASSSGAGPSSRPSTCGGRADRHRASRRERSPSPTARSRWSTTWPTSRASSRPGPTGRSASVAGDTLDRDCLGRRLRAHRRHPPDRRPHDPGPLTPATPPALTPRTGIASLFGQRTKFSNRP